MRGVLVVAHGSRQIEIERIFNQVMEPVEKCLKEVLIEKAYMEFSPQTIEKGLLKLIEKGATEIKIIPYFLFDGVHIEKAIPNRLEAFQLKYPSITLQLGKTLGTDPRLSEILMDRIME